MTSLKKITLTDFSGGLNTSADPTRIPPNQSPDLLNVEVLDSGAIRRRRGRTKAYRVGTGTIDFIDRFKSDATDRMIFHESETGTVYSTEIGQITEDPPYSGAVSALNSGLPTVTGARYASGAAVFVDADVTINVPTRPGLTIRGYGAYEVTNGEEVVASAAGIAKLVTPVSGTVDIHPLLVPSTQFVDAFDRADSADVGNGWSSLKNSEATDSGIIGNKLGLRMVALNDTPNYRIYRQVNTFDTAEISALVTRSLDSDGFVELWMANGGTISANSSLGVMVSGANIYLRYNGGTWSSLAGEYFGSVITLSRSKNTVVVKKDGVPVITQTADAMFPLKPFTYFGANLHFSTTGAPTTGDAVYIDNLTFDYSQTHFSDDFTRADSTASMGNNWTMYKNSGAVAGINANRAFVTRSNSSEPKWVSVKRMFPATGTPDGYLQETNYAEFDVSGCESGEVYVFGQTGSNQPPQPGFRVSATFGGNSMTVKLVYVPPEYEADQSEQLLGSKTIAMPASPFSLSIERYLGGQRAYVNGNIVVDAKNDYYTNDGATSVKFPYAGFYARIDSPNTGTIYIDNFASFESGALPPDQSIYTYLDMFQYAGNPLIEEVATVDGDFTGKQITNLYHIVSSDTSAVNKLVTYDGSEPASVSDRFTPVSPATFGGRYALTKQDRLLVAGKDGDEAILEYSAVNDTTKWAVADGGGALRPTPFGTGERTMGMVVWKDLIIWAGTSVVSSFNMSGVEENWEVKELTQDFGCVAGRSMVATPNGVVFLSQNGVVAYGSIPAFGGDGEGFSVLSDNLRGTLARVTTSAREHAVAAFFRGRYYLSLPLDGATQNSHTFVLKFAETTNDTPSWTLYDYGVASFFEDDAILYGGGYDGCVYELESGESDDGTRISMRYQTPLLGLGYTWKDYRELYVATDGSPGQLITITTETDGTVDAPTVLFTSPGDARAKRIAHRKKGNSVSVMIEGESSVEPITVTDITLTYNERKR